MKRVHVLIVAVALGGLFTAPAASAQEPRVPSTVGQGVSHAEVIEQLRQSGLTRAQARARLQQLGYDPSLVDRYFDAMESGGPIPSGTVSSEFLQGLDRIGASVRASEIQRQPGTMGMGATRPERPGVEALRPDSAEADESDEPAIFGRALFDNLTTQFDPVLTGPVDADYRLGPGDEVALILTGDVEFAYTLTVTREGYIVIPDVGQVFVNGLTLSELEDRLYVRLGESYSGVERGAEATTHFQVSLGRLRMNRVYIVGEVERPGAYQVSSVATVFNALYRAGGPNRNGSFRRIQVRRGGEVERTVDLYDYLLHGDSRDDVRLSQGDIVFVPPAGRQVTVKGAVRRPAIYELEEGDGLRSLATYAAGYDADAAVRRVQIDRILAPENRKPGVDRVLVDVDVANLMDEGGDFVPLRDGDVVQVFAVSKERRRRIVITGEVRRPGVYEWEEGTTLQDVIERAEGLHDHAYTGRAHIFRLNRADGTRRLIRTPLPTDSTGGEADVRLADRDSIVVYSRSELRNDETVTIDGFVKEPGTYPLAEGMTLKDLILAAGGFVHGAYVRQAEVARRTGILERTDTTAQVLRVPLSGSGSPDSTSAGDSDVTFRYGGDPEGRGEGGVSRWSPETDTIELRHGDQVFIRKAPGYEQTRTVTVTGEVMLPGKYVLRTREERIADLIERAGGISEEAYPSGARLVRDSELVATDLRSALAERASRDNVVLEAGDSVHVPAFDPTVLVRGAVTFEARVLYEPGEDLAHYVRQAGGYTDIADRERVSVTYPNGERSTIDRFLFFDLEPRIRPGSTIRVPDLPSNERDGINWERVITRSLSIAQMTLTTLVMMQQLSSN